MMSEVIELAPVEGRVKWFSQLRGFGFLVSDELEGDMLLHFSVLRPLGKRSVPEGATIRCVPARDERGLKVKEVLAIDFSTAVQPRPESTAVKRQAECGPAGDFEPVEVKWFDPARGYGFVTRLGSRDLDDVFLHQVTAKNARVGDLSPGQRLEAKIGEGPKGLVAVAVRERAQAA